ncbi:sigma-54-dependent Fis family transcriptional regulator [Wohlfahrtiimonas chitiniclastica]|uniref:sigma-54-dependent transcriptional regulator n=1 Tax=Wohlfahrtiimonas chitiniclastica TaxID=400946 RepID=UPI001BCF5EAA|nr:sigma-54 dependent transcriptional regulator [Wohlfahrtiimonas chitiniclastica]MBS7818367.1 sigma-54-dependent Fis family transcriptional regulator [Wohlfahrtiimonas chitiniclastica]MBS7826337.1 sigma-54-dependent Fis family transcriptional regulator [Wohlfahrtiimonas chitiniclastica]
MSDLKDTQILVVDDEEDINDLIKDILEDEGFSVRTACNGQEARDAIDQSKPDLVLLDIWMPDIDGISLLNEWKQSYQTLPFSVVMMSGHGTLEHAIEATKLGAFDFLEKPLTLAKLVAVVKRALKEQTTQPSAKPQNFNPQPVFEPVGKSSIMMALRNQAKQIAESGNRTVLLEGDIGAGKHLFAHYIHSLSDRAQQPLITVNLGQLSEENIEETLLGKEMGSHVTQGILEQASGGSVILDNVTQLSLEAQKKLADILSNTDYFRVNGKNLLPKNVRFIAISRDDLSVLVDEKEFNEALYYKLNVLPLEIPALSAHPEDVPDLIAFYIHHFVDEEHLQYRHFPIAVQNRLRNHTWHGNVQELKSVVQQLLVLGKNEEVSLDEVNQILTKKSQTHVIPEDLLPLDLPLREAREQFEKAYLLAQFKSCEGNIAKLAEKVGMERTNLYRKLKSLDIDPKKIG